MVKNSEGLAEKIKNNLLKKSYGLCGVDGAVQVCNYTKSSIRGKEGCWKEKFYGIDSSRCCQCTPCVMNCDNRCVHCWRPIEMNLGVNIKSFDEPENLLEEIIKARKKLLIGFGGRKEIDKEKLKKSFEPSLITLSLSGEATLYPKLPELIKLIRKRNAVSFLVTNGQNPRMIERLEKEKALPTQLTLSTNAPNKELFTRWHNPLRKDAWERFNKTIRLIKKLKRKCRRCIRLTLVAKTEDKNERLASLTNMADENILEYAKLIKNAEPDFIHVKGYTSIGSARGRMGYSKMPWFNQINDFSKKLLRELNSNLEKNEKPWKILGSVEKSSVVLIGKSKRGMKIRKV
jgi:tRNA wybutosine-synthesizing protein 1